MCVWWWGGGSGGEQNDAPLLAPRRGLDWIGLHEPVAAVQHVLLPLQALLVLLAAELDHQVAGGVVDVVAALEELHHLRRAQVAVRGETRGTPAC